MYIFWLLFSFNGRIGRSTYFFGGSFSGVVGTAFLMVAVVPLLDKAHPFTLSTLARVGAMGIVPLALMTWIGSALVVKRLHDLNRSGWLQLLFLSLPLLSLIAPLVATRAPIAAVAVSGVSFISSLYGIWIGLQLLFRKGQDGSNGYGQPGAPRSGAVSDDADAFASVAGAMERRKAELMAAAAAPQLRTPAPVAAGFAPVGARPRSFGKR
jgi:uncharacterized membrane protein YhaH (DUF805 family)